MKETQGQRRRRQRANWTEDDLLREEDGAFAQTLYILQMRQSGQDLAGELARLSKGRRDFEAANLAKKERTDRLAAIAQQLSAEGKSAAEIAKMADRGVRTVQRWMNRDMT